MFRRAAHAYQRLELLQRLHARMRAAGMRPHITFTRRNATSGWDAEDLIASLAAEGLTNPQLAERLFLSRRTVQNHMSHVLGKLGPSSRVD